MTSTDHPSADLPTTVVATPVVATTVVATTVVPMRSRLLAEAVGSGLLVISVVGSGIMAETLSPGDVGLQLLENAAATAGALVALIIMLATVSGAHFNPAVTLVDRLMRTTTTKVAGLYIASQITGGLIGVVLANLMFEDQTGLGAISISQHDRDSGSALLAEIIATIGLLLVIHGAVRHAKPYVVGVAVGVWIGGAYFFTSSTSFANPMITIARMFTDTFAGIAPSSAPAFIMMQLLGAVLAVVLIRELFHRAAPSPAAPAPTAIPFPADTPSPNDTPSPIDTEEVR